MTFSIHIDKDNGNRATLLRKAGNDLPKTFISEAMKRALADLCNGPAERLDNGFWRGEGEGRLLIRRQTIKALELCWFLTQRRAPPYRLFADLTEVGRAYAAQNPPKAQT